MPAEPDHGGAAGTLPAAPAHGGAAGTVPAEPDHGGAASKQQFTSARALRIINLEAAGERADTEGRNSGIFLEVLRESGGWDNADFNLCRGQRWKYLDEENKRKDDEARMEACSVAMRNRRRTYGARMRVEPQMLDDDDDGDDEGPEAPADAVGSAPPGVGGDDGGGGDDGVLRAPHTDHGGAAVHASRTACRVSSRHNDAACVWQPLQDGWTGPRPVTPEMYGKKVHFLQDAAKQLAVNGASGVAALVLSEATGDHINLGAEARAVLPLELWSTKDRATFAFGLEAETRVPPPPSGPAYGGAAATLYASTRPGLEDQAYRAMLAQCATGEQMRLHAEFPLLLERLCPGERPSVGELPSAVLVDVRFAMEGQRVLLDFTKQMVQRMHDCPLKGLLMHAVSNPDRALDRALNAAANTERASALPYGAAGKKLEPPALAPLESTFGILPVGLLLLAYLLQYLHPSTGKAEQARLEAVTERVVFTTPGGSPDLSCGFHESLTALDENMTKVRQLKMHFDAKPLAETLISTLIHARHLTIDTKGSWEKFAEAEFDAFDPFHDPRAVYPEEFFVSLVDRILELEMAIALKYEFFARFSRNKTAHWPPPREAVEWTLRSIRGGVVTRV